MTGFGHEDAAFSISFRNVPGRGRMVHRKGSGNLTLHEIVADILGEAKYLMLPSV